MLLGLGEALHRGEHQRVGELVGLDHLGPGLLLRLFGRPGSAGVRGLPSPGGGVVSGELRVDRVRADRTEDHQPVQQTPSEVGVDVDAGQHRAAVGRLE